MGNRAHTQDDNIPRGVFVDTPKLGRPKGVGLDGMTPAEYDKPWNNSETRWNISDPAVKKELQDQAWELRVVGRLSYRQIAQKLNISTFTAHSYVKELAKTRSNELREKNKTIVCKQDTIYEALLDKWIKIALDEETDTTMALYATDRITKVLVDQAKLHGFHMIKDTTIPTGLGKEVGIAVIEAMARLAQKQPKKVVEAEVITPEITDAKAE